MSKSTGTLDTEWIVTTTRVIDSLGNRSNKVLSEFTDKEVWSLISLLEIEIESRKDRFLEG